MSIISGKKVVVTGGQGFLGRFVIRKLERLKANIFAPSKDDYDFRRLDDCLKAFKGAEIVIHLAAIVGGIEFNRKNQGSIYYDNVVMNTNVIEAARLANVEKVIQTSSACGYPRDAIVPLKEATFFDGAPEPTNRTYGYAKRLMVVQGQAYREQYGMNIISLVLFNMFGPGDNFNPETSHVIPSLIMKCCSDKKLVVWGDGTPTRSFLYVEDGAEAVAKAAEMYVDMPNEPINIGTDEEITIKELVQLIVKHTGFKGNIEFDRSKPNGQPRRCSDVSKAKELFDFEAKTPFEDGLKKTIEYYKGLKKII